MKLKKAHKLTKKERSHLKEMQVKAADTILMNRQGCPICDDVFYKLQARKEKQK